MPNRSLFPYFGAKSKIAHLYDAPQHKLVIEPFAGGASYSLLYANDIASREVWINDLNPATYELWKYVTTTPAKDILAHVPERVDPGMTMDDLAPQGAPAGLVSLLRSQFAQGAFGMKGTRSKVAPFGALAWKSFRQRIHDYVPLIQGWTVTNLPYQELPNQKATWFIDPPYNNAAGRTYNMGADGIDFVELGAWCKERQGQVMVCENAGADWLPFVTLTDKRLGIYNESIKSEVGEVIYQQSDSEEIGLFA